MATLNNIKISLRTDYLSNWIELNPVLNAGELAIVTGENGNQMFKIGDGSTSFSDLSYMNENEVKTKEVIADEVTAKSVAQGVRASAVPLGFASGAFVSANANFSQALGYDSEVSSGHDYSFVWNGDDDRDLLDYYTSKGKGTFSINPKSGFDGLFIGETSFYDILNSISAPSGEKILILSADIKFLSSEISSASQRISSNANLISVVSSQMSTLAHVYFNDQIAGVEGYNDLSVLKMTSKQYESVLETSSIVSNAIYILSSENENMFGQRVINVGAPEEADDATTKDYVDTNFLDVSSASSLSSDITASIPTKVSQLANDSGYLTAHQSLTAYALTSQLPTKTSQLTNDSGYLTSHQSLTAYYQKTETSSSSEVHVALESLQPKGDYLLSSNLSFNYDSTTKYIYLKAFGSDEIGSVNCADFIKDGMLSSVQLCGNVLVFKFNTDAGTTPVSVNLSSFVDNYDEKIAWLSSSISADVKNLADNYFTKAQSQEISNSITAEVSAWIPSKNSQLSNDSGFLVSNDISDYAKVWVKDIDGNQGYNDLSVLNVTNDEFQELVIEGTAVSNAIYIVSCATTDQYGQRIVNLGAPVDLSDATTKEYVDSLIESIPLSDYALKDEAQEISSQLTSNYALKTEASAISTNLTSNYATKSTVQSVSSDITSNYLLTSTASSISTSVTAMIPTKNSQLSNDEQFAKVFFNQDDTMLPDDLSVNKVSHDDYVERVLNDDILSNELFVISSDDFDAWGSQISNVTMSEDGEAYLGIAATKPYVDELSAKVNPILEAFSISAISDDTVLSIFTTSPSIVDTSVAVSAVCYIFQKLLH